MTTATKLPYFVMAGAVVLVAALMLAPVASSSGTTMYASYKDADFNTELDNIVAQYGTAIYGDDEGRFQATAAGITEIYVDQEFVGTIIGNVFHPYISEMQKELAAPAAAPAAGVAVYEPDLPVYYMSKAAYTGDQMILGEGIDAIEEARAAIAYRLYALSIDVGADETVIYGNGYQIILITAAAAEATLLDFPATTLSEAEPTIELRVLNEAALVQQYGTLCVADGIINQ